MKLLFLLLCCLSLNLFVLAHEGHQETVGSISENIQAKVKDVEQGEESKTWKQLIWIGSFHLILLHFPIALINMLAISEVLLIWYRQPIFEFSSRFMLISTAIISPPTALLGFIYSYSAFYSGLIETFLFWHMWLGILTAAFAVAILFIRERVGLVKFYYTCLILLFLMINITGFFGGGMTFGPEYLFPPH